MRALTTWMEDWLSRRTEKRSASHDRARFENHIATYAPFQELTLGSLRDYHIEDFLADLSTRYSEQTVRHVFNLIRQALNDACKREVVQKNVAEYVRVPRQPRSDDPWTYLEPHEIATLVAASAIPRDRRQAFALAIYTGLRKGEMLALRWEDVVLGGRRPHIAVRYSHDGAAKSGRVGRTPLLPMAVAIFREMIEDQGGVPGGLVWPDGKGNRRQRAFDFGWSDRNGRPGLKRRAGIERPVRFHDLRHTAAASLISGVWGEPWRIEEVREFMRHSDIKVTQRYAHLNPDGLHAKAARMGPARIDWTS